jgi:hypothetical protein
VQLRYSVHGLAGRVDVDVGTTESSGELRVAGAAGLPFCEATVSRKMRVSVGWSSADKDVRAGPTSSPYCRPQSGGRRFRE